jgi:phage terminase large subunit-like protein
MDFFKAGKDCSERLFMAGNQLGKTYAGGAETTYHLTGAYPDWWPGRVFKEPVRMWAGSLTNELVRDGVQRILIGEPKDQNMWGQGLIPKRLLKDWARKPGVPDALDSVIVQHITGGQSVLGFKSYDQGRTKWQSETLNGVWFDEEPPLDVYVEGLTRTNVSGQFTYMTFTPLLGMSDVVHSFIKECGLG